MKAMSFYEFRSEKTGSGSSYIFEGKQNHISHNCCLELLGKLQKRICRTVGPSLVASHEPMAHRQNVASSSSKCGLFYRYYFGRCSSELAQLVHFLFLEVGLLVVLIYCMIFLSPYLDVTRVSTSTVSFLA